MKIGETLKIQERQVSLEIAGGRRPNFVTITQGKKPRVLKLQKRVNNITCPMRTFYFCARMKRGWSADELVSVVPATTTRTRSYTIEQDNIKKFVKEITGQDTTCHTFRRGGAQ